MNAALDTSQLELLSLAIESAASGICVLDAHAQDFPFTYINPAFTRITGFEREDVLGKSVSCIAGAETDRETLAKLIAALQEGATFNGEFITYRKNGESFWARWSLRPLYSAQRTLTHFVATQEDVTDRRRIRESLRASEARLELAMAASELAMWDWNVTRDEVYYNDQWRPVLGIDPREFLGREDLWDRLLLPTEHPEIIEDFQRHCRGDNPLFEAEYALPTAFGVTKWFAVRAKVVRRTEQGQPLRVIGVLRDITRRRQTLEEIEASQLRWERAVRGTSDGLYDWDLVTGHVWYAPRFRELLGYSEGNFPDSFSAFQQVVFEDDRFLVLGAIRSHLENRLALDVRCRLKTHSGARLWVRLRGQAERDAAGRPHRLAGSISDISAQIEAEEALTRSQDFYSTLLNSLPMYVAYAESDERIVFANKLFRSLFSQDLHWGSHPKVLSVLGPTRYGALGPLVQRAINGETVEVQGRFNDAAGRDLDMDTAFLPHRDGEARGCFVVARDMTDRRQLEAELRQSQKMEAVGRLTGGIAHDFNNLLSVMIGNSQLLCRSMRESPRLLKQADAVLKAAMRGAELTKRLLAFSRQQVLAPRVIDPNGLLSGMYELLRRALSSEIELHCELDREIGCVKIDASQLENAVLNLVINARDAMREGGQIIIRTRNEVVDAASIGHDGVPRGEYVVLEVVDSGTGMPPEVLKRAFEPFYTTKEVGKGSGLGLSMVYGFVKQSGGHVYISSVLGLGTTVHIYLPVTVARVERPNLEIGNTSELPRGQETILVVEDDAEVRTTAVAILQSLGYQVLEASTGGGALELFHAHPEIAVVFSDVMLPGGMMGTSLARRLRESRPTLKVLLTSGFADTNIIDRGMLTEANEILLKPYRLEDLARRIRALIDRVDEVTHVSA
jgi:PAS domain S-box-containing protein